MNNSYGRERPRSFAGWCLNDSEVPREAVVGDGAAPASMDPRWMVEPGEKLPETIEFPTPRLPREEQQEQFVRDLEIDPKLYYPTGAFREPVQKWPGVTLNPREMLKAKGIEIDDE